MDGPYGRRSPRRTLGSLWGRRGERVGDVVDGSRGVRRMADAGLGLFTAWAWVTAVATFLLVIVGAAVVATGAGLSCGGWPLCEGHVIPHFGGVVVVEWSHRVGALTVTALSLVTTITAWRLRLGGPWWKASVTAMVLLVAQVLLGAIVVDHLAAWAVVFHEGLGVLLLCVWLGTALFATSWRRAQRAASPSPSAGATQAPRQASS